MRLPRIGIILCHAIVVASVGDVRNGSKVDIRRLAFRRTARHGIMLRGSAQMSFDRIGPYELTRGDLVAAAIVVSFLTARRSLRIIAAVYVLLGLMMVIAGVLFGVPLLVGLGIWFVLWVFVIGPALRSRKGHKDIYLEYSPEGIVGETPQIRTTYKWTTIGKAKKVGSRLFIMITDRIALVVPDRSTSPDNMNRLVATLSDQAATTAP